MGLLRRHRYFLLALCIYWPGIFIFTHIPRLPRWFGPIGMSDKMLHYLAYLALVFLWWVSVSPYDKVNWRKAKVWVTLAVMVWYGAIDEWLQVYVGRNCDVHDFFADLGGTLLGLIILTILTFWPALLVVSAIFIFAMTNLTKGAMIGPNTLTHSAFGFLAYSVFTLIWIQYIHRYIPLRKFQLKWFVTATAVPVFLLLVVKMFGPGFGKEVWLIDLLGALTAIVTVVMVSFLTCRGSCVTGDNELRKEIF